MNRKRKTTQKNEQAWLKRMQAGKNSFERGQSRQSARAFQRATEILPGRVEGWVNLGSALLESAQFEASEQALKKAIALDPRLMVAHMILGDAQRMTGKVDESIASYKTAVGLQRTPLALNKLACILRVRNQFEEAAALYLEAIKRDSRLSLARVNHATLQLDLGHYDDAARQLDALANQALPPPEREEVASARQALAHYSRLHPAISAMRENNDLAPLREMLRNAPESSLQPDEAAMQGALRYRNSTRNFPSTPAAESIALPEDWPLIEAMFMVPVVNSVADYQKLKAELEEGMQPTGDLLESLNMVAAIDAARGCREDMRDPVQAELHLRHWHALACNGVEGIMGGHFKYTQNWTAKSPTLKRVDPAMASGTLQHFVEHICNATPPGIARAAMIFLSLLDFHPFADGNARVALTWANRELEWAGMMPMLFNREMGLKHELGDANIAVRGNGGDLTPLVNLMERAQQFAREFCQQLADDRG